MVQPQPDKESEMPPPVERTTRRHFEERARVEDSGEGERRKPSMGGGITQYIIMLVLALIVSYVMTSYIGVSKGDFTKNFQEVTASVNTVKAEIKASQDAVTSAVNNLPNTVTTQVNNAIGQFNSRITAVEGTANNANQQVSTIAGKIDTANSNITTLTNNINTLANSVTEASNKIADVSAKLATANSGIDALKAQLTSDEARIKVLEDKLAGTGSGGGTSSIPEPFTYTTLITNDGDATTTTTDTSTPPITTYTAPFSFKLTLENPTESDLEDISIIIPIDVSTPKNIVGRTIATSGWTFQEWGTDYLTVKERSIKLNAGEKKRIYIDIMIYFSGSISSGDSWSADINDKDIDILSWDYK
jgi:TolA-binding protein